MPRPRGGGAGAEAGAGPGKGQPRGVPGLELGRAGGGEGGSRGGRGGGGRRRAGGGGGGRREQWRRLRPAVRLQPPEEDEAEDRAPLTQFAAGGELPGAGGPLVLPVPAAGRPEPAEQEEGE